MMVDVLTVAIKCGERLRQIQHRWLTAPQVDAAPLPCFCGEEMQAGHMHNSFAHNFKYCTCRCDCDDSVQLVSVPFHNAAVVVGAVIYELVTGILEVIGPRRQRLISWGLSQVVDYPRESSDDAVDAFHYALHILRPRSYENATLQTFYQRHKGSIDMWDALNWPRPGTRRTPGKCHNAE